MKTGQRYKAFCRDCSKDCDDSVVVEDPTHDRITEHGRFMAKGTCPQCGRTLYLGLFESLGVAVAEGIPGAAEKLAYHREQQQIVLSKICAKLPELG